MSFTNRVPVPQRWHGGADVPEHPVRHGINDRSVERLLTETLGAQRNGGYLQTCAAEEMSLDENPGDWARLTESPRWADDAAEAERLLAEHTWLASLLATHASITEQRLGLFALDHLYDGSGFGEGDVFAHLLEFIDQAGTVLWSPKQARDDAHREQIEERRADLIERLLRDQDPVLYALLMASYDDGVNNEQAAPDCNRASWRGVGVIAVLACLGGGAVGWVARTVR